MCIELNYEEMPTATLPNGVVVGNFSSEHPFFLRDRNGKETIVPACSPQRNDAMKLSVTLRTVVHRVIALRRSVPTCVTPAVGFHLIYRPLGRMRT